MAAVVGCCLEYSNCRESDDYFPLLLSMAVGVAVGVRAQVIGYDWASTDPLVRKFCP